jgi:hypothetical protein
MRDRAIYGTRYQGGAGGEGQTSPFITCRSLRGSRDTYETDTHFTNHKYRGARTEQGTAGPEPLWTLSHVDPPSQSLSSDAHRHTARRDDLAFARPKRPGKEGWNR